MSKKFQLISPVDDSIYLERGFATNRQIEHALQLAEKSQRQWQQIRLEDRAAICRKALDYFLKNVDEIALELCWQMGRPIRYAPFEITKGFQERARYMIDIAEEALQNIVIENSSDSHRFIRRVPLGTICVLSPWNYPYLTSVNAIIPGLMAGNSIIVKHAKQTPLCAERYAKAFESAGLPKGVFQYLHLNHPQVASLVADNRINYIAFTGSVTGGKAIQQSVNHRFINTGLELGGKDPAYVMKDADLENTVENLVDGSFFNSGQSCCGIERIYVHKSIFSEFVDRFTTLTNKYLLGNPLNPDTTLGPVVRATAASFVQNQIDQAISKGATGLIDPSHFPKHKIGTPYMAPQVLIGVDHSMDIMKEESFGPVVGIMPVQNDNEAIQYMNDSQYGLTASIWTKDDERALEIARDIRSGTIFMNRCDYLDPALAWTGVKNSGKGATLSRLGYDSLTRPQSIHFQLYNKQ